MSNSALAAHIKKMMELFPMDEIFEAMAVEAERISKTYEFNGDDYGVAVWQETANSLRNIEL